MQLAYTALERRTSLVLIQYWNELRAERDFPHEDEINPDRLEEVWERCFLVQVRDIEQVTDYNYTYFGPALLEQYDNGTLDAQNGLMVAPDASRLAHRYCEVMESREPVLDENRYVNTAGKTVLFRQAFMPLGRAGKGVESILGGAWFRLA